MGELRRAMESGGEVFDMDGCTYKMHTEFD